MIPFEQIENEQEEINDYEATFIKPLEPKTIILKENKDVKDQHN